MFGMQRSAGDGGVDIQRTEKTILMYIIGKVVRLAKEYLSIVRKGRERPPSCIIHLGQPGVDMSPP